MADIGTITRIDMIVDGERCSFELNEECDCQQGLIEPGKIIRIDVYDFITTTKSSEGSIVIKLHTKKTVTFFGTIVRIVSED